MRAYAVGGADVSDFCEAEGSVVVGVLVLGVSIVWEISAGAGGVVGVDVEDIAGDEFGDFSRRMNRTASIAPAAATRDKARFAIEIGGSVAITCDFTVPRSLENVAVFPSMDSTLAFMSLMSVISVPMSDWIVAVFPSMAVNWAWMASASAVKVPMSDSMVSTLPSTLMSVALMVVKLALIVPRSGITMVPILP